jgi:hypothetical protein
MMSQGVQLVCLGTGTTDLEVRLHGCCMAADYIDLVSRPPAGRGASSPLLYMLLHMLHGWLPFAWHANRMISRGFWLHWWQLHELSS